MACPPPAMALIQFLIHRAHIILGMTEFSELTCDDVHVISFLNKVEGEAVALNCSASTETNIENKLIEALCNDFLLSGRVAPSDVSAKIEVGSSVFILCA